jgi:hypothetical protein
MNGLTTAGRQKPVLAILLAVACAGGEPLAADKPAGDVASFLAW